MFVSSVERGPIDNRGAARALFSVAALLESQGANPFRVWAYRRAALGLLRLEGQASSYATPAGELDLPGLGPSLRRKLGELVTQGQLAFHQQLLADLPSYERELLAVPGIGPRTARRLIGELGIRGLRGLIRAAEQGRLRTVRGIGAKREQQLAEWARALLDRAA